jgi:chemosensory pili system protein ChpA (sensor histidine kinase/response regulator)
MGYEDVRSVRSAARALVLVEKYRPAIIFVDIEMPEEGAFALARDVRGQAKQRAVRLIALTNSVEHPAREAARLVGYERFLVKPASEADLEACVGKPS